jgi:DNA-binding NarL/FixJ family response regulator
MVNIIIADDHEMFVEALVALFDEGEEIAVAATAVNGAGVLALLEIHRSVDVVVLDISMPGIDGIETLTEMRRRGHCMPVLMLTQEAHGGTIVRALKAGAAGYVLKTSRRAEFVEAIATVASGGEFISEAAKASMIARLTGRRSNADQPPLTRRELEVIRLIALGRTTSEMATELFISSYTVETHRRNLLQKLGLRNAAALARYAVEHGLVDE